MHSNKLIKLLCSFPIILMFLYFIPFLGVCLILLRHFVYNRKNLSSIVLIVIGILILIPQLVNSILKILNVNVDTIPYLGDIVNSNIYINLIDYSKFLISVGIIILVVSFIFRSIFDKLENFIRSYIIEQEKRNAEISRKNDMEIKIKQEKAKNTHVIYCPNCGADNILTSNVGQCKYCRRQIEYKE